MLEIVPQHHPKDWLLHFSLFWIDAQIEELYVYANESHSRRTAQ
jgi:hypothetical protein